MRKEWKRMQWVKPSEEVGYIPEMKEKTSSCALPQDHHIYQKSPDFVARKVTDEVILVPVRGRVGDLEAVLTLNEVGTLIWEQVDGRRPVHEIVDAVVAEFEVPRERAETDVKRFLADLLRVGCLVLTS